MVTEPTFPGLLYPMQNVPSHWSLNAYCCELGQVL
jgi:hypothetical protein